MKTNLDELSAHHRSLLAGYARILRGAANLPFFINLQKQKLTAFPQSKHPVGQAMTSLFSAVFQFFYIRGFVNLFVESHIRSKLTQLARAYIQQAQMPDVNDETKTWLKDTARDCRDFNETLDSWTSIRGVMAFFFPLITGMGLAFASAPNLYVLFAGILRQVTSAPQTPDEFLARLGLILSLGDTLLYGSLIGFGVILLSFTLKRKIFLGETAAGNIYKMEDVLFALIERRKEAELPVDILSVWGALFLPFAVLGLIVRAMPGATGEPQAIFLQVVWTLTLLSASAALLIFRFRKVK